MRPHNLAVERTRLRAAHRGVIRTRPRTLSLGRGAMRYKIALLKTDEGYSVSVPGLPGCWSQGATEEEALQNIQDAIQEYLTVRDELLEGAVVREVEVTP